MQTRELSQAPTPTPSRGSAGRCSTPFANRPVQFNLDLISCDQAVMMILDLVNGCQVAEYLALQ